MSTSERSERVRARERRYRERHRDALAQRAAERRVRGDDPAWKTNIKQKYGITPDDYFWLMFIQGGTCAICQRPESAVQCGKVRRLSIDHHHDSGRVRALLCQNCNAILGLAQESSRRLLAAASYLGTHS